MHSTELRDELANSSQRKQQLTDRHEQKSILEILGQSDQSRRPGLGGGRASLEFSTG